MKCSMLKFAISGKDSIKYRYLLNFFFTSGDKGQDISKFKDDLILLHPSLMQVAGICIGGHCIINDSHVRLAWPCSSLPLTGMGIQDDLLEQLGEVRGHLITIQSHDKFSAASLVELACSDSR